MTLVTYRDTELDRGGPLARVLADLRRDGSVEALRIRGLDERAVAALLDAADAAFDERLARRIAIDTGGNPLFIREVVAHLIESGRSEIVVPEELRQVIEQRVARLSEPARRALRVGAVVGPTFSVPIVERVMSDEPEVIDALDEAASAGLLAEAGHGDYSFAHALVRQTIYDGLGTARRMRLHRQVGEALEASRDAAPEALAHHFAAAASDDQARKAASYALTAGRSAVRRAGYDEAAAHYERGLHALEAAGRPDEKLRRELVLALGRTHYEPLPDLSQLPSWIWRRLRRPARSRSRSCPPSSSRSCSRSVHASSAPSRSARRCRNSSAHRRSPRVPSACAPSSDPATVAERRPSPTSAPASGYWTTSASRSAPTRASASPPERSPGPSCGSTASRSHARSRAPPPHDQPSARTGRYACLAVTSDLHSGAPAPVGATGHPYRTRIDFHTGRYAFCKIAGYPGKTIPTTRDPLVPLPRACGGRS